MGADFTRMFGDVGTAVQVPAHQGFASEAIHTRTTPHVKSDTTHTMRLATPAPWAQRDDLPCLKTWEQSYDEACADGHPRKVNPFDLDAGARISDKDAKALCFGCPVLDECLEAALAEEVDHRPATNGKPLGAQHRYGVRGGMSPRGRADLAKPRPKVKLGGLCKKGLHERTEETQAMHSHGKHGIRQVCLPCRAEHNRQVRARKQEQEEAA